MPILYCISPGLHPKRGGFVFSNSITFLDDATALLRFARARGWTKTALITATDAAGQEADRAFAQALALPENSGLRMVDQQHFANGDISVSGQMNHIAGEHPDVIIAFQTGTSFGTLLHGIRDAGISAAVMTAPGNMVRSQLDPGLAGMSLVPNAPAGVRKAHADYLATLAAGGLEVGVNTAASWDYLMVLVTALQRVGPTATAAQLRDSIDNLRGWVPRLRFATLGMTRGTSLR